MHYPQKQPQPQPPQAARGLKQSSDEKRTKQITKIADKRSTHKNTSRFFACSFFPHQNLNLKQQIHQEGRPAPARPGSARPGRPSVLPQSDSCLQSKQHQARRLFGQPCFNGNRAVEPRNRQEKTAAIDRRKANHNHSGGGLSKGYNKKKKARRNERNCHHSPPRLLTPFVPCPTPPPVTIFPPSTCNPPPPPKHPQPQLARKAAKVLNTMRQQSNAV